MLASILSVMMRTSKRLKKLAACTKAWTLTLHAALHAYTVLCDAWRWERLLTKGIP